MTDGEGKADIGAKLKGEKKEQWQKLKDELAKFDHLRPRPIAVHSGGDRRRPGRARSDDSRPPRRRADRAGAAERAGTDRARHAPRARRRVTRRRQSLPTTLTTGRRTALAQWIASPDNPLPSRVLANRLWQHHFGRGLANRPAISAAWASRRAIPSCSTGWPASCLDNDWSIKRLHRQMVTSAAYRQASHGPEVAAAAAKDPPTSGWPG